MAEDDALFQKGMPIRREVLGPEYVDASSRQPNRAIVYYAWDRFLDRGRQRGANDL
jgi:hypothetical protein